MVKIIDVSMMISSDATVHTCEGLRVDRDSFGSVIFAELGLSASSPTFEFKKHTALQRGDLGRYSRFAWSFGCVCSICCLASSRSVPVLRLAVIVHDSSAWKCTV